MIWAMVLVLGLLLVGAVVVGIVVGARDDGAVRRRQRVDRKEHD